MELPGWNSIQATGVLSNVFFFLSIGALVLLGMSEVAQHFYGQRHDGLLAQKQQAEKDASDGEIARLHRDTAEANARANEAALALEKFKAPRGLDITQQNTLVDHLRRFRGTLVDVFLIHAPTADAAPLANFIVGVLRVADWNARGVSNLLGGPTGIGITVAIRHDASASEEAAANALVTELNGAGITAHMNSERIVRDNPVDVLGAFVGPATADSKVWVVVASKP